MALGDRLARGGDDHAVGADRRAAAGSKLCAGDLVPGVIARANERAGFDMPEPERERLDLHLSELIGVVIALDRQVLERRPQVLADREDVGVDLAQGLEGLGQLWPRLAEADHQRALRVGDMAVIGGVDLCALNDAQRPVPSFAPPDWLMDAPN